MSVCVSAPAPGRDRLAPPHLLHPHLCAAELSSLRAAWVWVENLYLNVTLTALWFKAWVDRPVEATAAPVIQSLPQVMKSDVREHPRPISLQHRVVTRSLCLSWLTQHTELRAKNDDVITMVVTTSGSVWRMLGVCGDWHVYRATFISTLTSFFSYEGDFLCTKNEHSFS